MKCPLCGQKVENVRSLHVQGGRVIERRCPQGHRWLYQEQIVHQIQTKGDGVHAARRRINGHEEDRTSEAT